MVKGGHARPSSRSSADWSRVMWRTVGFVLALALTVGGAGWLVFQLFIAEEFSRNLVVAAAICSRWVSTGCGPITFQVIKGEGRVLACSLRPKTERVRRHRSAIGRV